MGAGIAPAAARATHFDPFAEHESLREELGDGFAAAQGRAGAASASLRHASLRSAGRSARTVDAIRRPFGATRSK
jgi:hypothetical protein